MQSESRQSFSEHYPSPPFDLERFDTHGVDAVRSKLQSLAKGSSSRQAVAEQIVGYLYDNFRTPETDEPACVLVRCFQTSSYARLPLHYRDVADQLLELTPSHPKMRCLSLLATRGAKLVWNDVSTSLGHLCIPMPSVEVVKRAPMISRLLEQIGVSVEQMVTPSEQMVTPSQTPELILKGQISNEAEIDNESQAELNVFHVERASDSPYIPAQKEFVQPFRVHSVVGMGGLLPDGELFVVILFSRVAITRHVAQLFRSLVPGIQELFLPFGPDKTFGHSSE